MIEARSMNLEKAIGTLLRQKGWTLSIAESCTGGWVSNRMTNVSGSSDYFEGGVVSYSNRAKMAHLSIPEKVIQRYGAVSPQVAGRMAQGVRNVFHTTFGLSTTGVAGPTGGTKKTPVGRVFIAVSDGKRALVRKETIKGSRRTIKRGAAEKSLKLLYHYLLKKAQSACLR
jgi:nicotinamide-nucleotide amidase